MKKINFISIDSIVLKWIYDKLRLSELPKEKINEILIGIEEIMTKKVTSLMLELNDLPTFTNENIIVCDELIINYKERIVTRNNTIIQLTPKEFDILYFLAKNRGEIFTKEQIYQAVWEEEYYLDDSNIMAFIRKLRKKIEKNPDSPEYILTIWGIGYKFKN